MTAALIEAGLWLDGAVVGWAGGWLLRRLGRAWRMALLVAGPAGILLLLVWWQGWLDLGRGAAPAACALLCAFVAACDLLCRCRRQRLLFLGLCGGLATLLMSHTWGRVAAAAELSRIGCAVEGGVILQQTGYTCLPASACTCLIRLGCLASEAELADEAGTTWNGTLLPRMVPVLARRLEGRGWRVRMEDRTWETLPRDGTPAILDTDLGWIGHAVAFLGFQGERALIGDPLGGPGPQSRQVLEARWSGKGIFFEREPAQAEPSEGSNPSRNRAP